MTHKSVDAVRPRRPGPKSRIDNLQLPSQSVEPLSEKLLTDQQWFARYGGFMVRDSCGDETCAVDLEVDPDMVGRIRKNLEALSGTAVHDHFVSCAGSGKKVPPLPREDNKQNAISISRALIREAKQRPSLVCTAVCAYTNAVRRSDKLLVLTEPKHAQFGRSLIDIVRSLDLRFLRWRIRGFETDKTPRPLPKTVPKEWCELLGIPSNTPISWIPPKNKKNPASASQIAVEVVEKKRGGSLQVSSNFHSVMLVARVVLIP
jgi:hypothetical protein